MCDVTIRNVNMCLLFSDASRRHASFFAQRKTATFKLPSGPVILDDAIHNIGYHYNPTNGIFTAPYTGVYLFAVQIFVSENQANRVIVDLAKNNEPISRMAFYSSPLSGVSDSTTVVVSLKAQDKIQVLGRELAGQSVLGSYHTFFTGSLLFSA